MQFGSAVSDQKVEGRGSHFRRIFDPVEVFASDPASRVLPFLIEDTLPALLLMTSFTDISALFSQGLEKMLSA